VNDGREHRTLCRLLKPRVGRSSGPEALHDDAGESGEMAALCWCPHDGDVPIERPSQEVQRKLDIGIAGSLRTSNYYRAAEFFQRKAPATDPIVLSLSRSARDTFVAATALMDRPVEQLRIPYEDTTLPGRYGSETLDYQSHIGPTSATKHALTWADVLSQGAARLIGQLVRRHLSLVAGT
jgi:hypothetical protein